MIKNIAVMILVPLVFFLALEFGLRVSPWNGMLGPGRFYGGLEDHSLFWEPNSLIRIPKDGARSRNEFRGKQVALEKPPGVFRIICLGGSFTYGWPYNDSPAIAYPARLEEMLNAESPRAGRYEVVNAGVGGYTSYQALYYFTHRLYKFKPDLVSVCFGGNDGNNNYEIGSLCSDREYYRRLSGFSKNKALYAFRQSLNSLRTVALMEKIVFQIKKLFIPPAPRVPPREFRENLEEFIRLAKLYDFKLLFILEPHIRLQPFDREIESNPYYRAMAELSLREPQTVTLVDTISLARQYPDREIFLDKMHLTILGHEKIAGLIYSIIDGKL